MKTLCMIVLAGWAAVASAHAQDAPAAMTIKKLADFPAATFERDGHRIPYRFYQPPALQPGVKYPLVILLHGFGERGDDNTVQLPYFSGVNFWEKNPCFVILPQCPKDDPGGEATWVKTGFGAPAHTMAEKPTWPLQAVMDLLDETVQKQPVDADRVYLSGLSMGGFATWELLQRRPGFFAAAVPVCGGADLAFAAELAKVPLWIWHGGNDGVVKTQRSRDIVKAIEAAGGTPKYTELPGVGHNSWTVTYKDPAMWDWLFAQRRVP